MLAPAEVVRRAHAAGLAAIALTDHDTVAGVPEAVAEGDRLGLRVVSGCEFSVQAPWGEIHVLGYFLPLDDPAMDAFLLEARQLRITRAERIVAALKAWGVDIETDHVMAEAGSAAVGRPHVARALVRLGKVPDVATAFDDFLGQGRRAYVEKVLPTLREVADLVHATGGLISVAHLRERANRSTLALLQQDGLDAVEVRHPSHSPETTAGIAGQARALGLLLTGGSDWHGDGAGNPNSALGTQVIPIEWLQALDQAAMVK